MGSVIPLKKSANSAYLDLKNMLGDKLLKVESLIEQKLKSDVDLIKKMSEHHLKSGGKRLRALLTLESAKLTGYKEDNRDINLAACVELIHSATLLHDDVIDESSLRRGVKTSRGSKLKDPEKNNIFTGEFWTGKTSLDLGLIDGIGNADQILKEKFFGKEIGKDFYEGKVTLPLITIFQKGNEEEKKFLTEIMKKDKRTDDDFSETLALIFKYKAVEASLKKAEYFVNVSYDALAIFPESEDKKILQRLTSFSLNRSF